MSTNSDANFATIHYKSIIAIFRKDIVCFHGFLYVSPQNYHKIPIHQRTYPDLFYDMGMSWNMRNNFFFMRRFPSFFHTRLS